jgi:hypothetical protein
MPFDALRFVVQPERPPWPTSDIRYNALLAVELAIRLGEAKVDPQIAAMVRSAIKAGAVSR